MQQNCHNTGTGKYYYLSIIFEVNRHQLCSYSLIIFSKVITKCQVLTYQLSLISLQATTNLYLRYEAILAHQSLPSWKKFIASSYAFDFNILVFSREDWTKLDSIKEKKLIKSYVKHYPI